jgi:hypothetical protein
MEQVLRNQIPWGVLQGKQTCVATINIAWYPVLGTHAKIIRNHTVVFFFYNE